MVLLYVMIQHLGEFFYPVFEFKNSKFSDDSTTLRIVFVSDFFDDFFPGLGVQIRNIFVY